MNRRQTLVVRLDHLIECDARVVPANDKGNVSFSADANARDLHSPIEHFVVDAVNDARHEPHDEHENS